MSLAENNQPPVQAGETPAASEAGEARLEQRVENLSLQKQELLRRLSRRQALISAAGSDGHSATPEEFPASPGQTSLWLIDQMSPGDPVYNMPLGMRLSGKVDPAAFEAALNDVVAAHEALRSWFRVSDGVPRRVVESHVRVPFQQVDLSGASDSQSALLDLFDREAKRGFDLASPPLLRATLARLSETEHALLLVIHHTIVDGHSLGIILQDLARCFAAKCQGVSAALPSGKLYSQFVAWQDQWSKSSAGKQALDYFAGVFSKPRTPLQLPLDHPRSQARSFAGQSVICELDRDLALAIEQSARRMRATPFMLVLSAYAVLLHRYCNQDDLLIGAPASNRLQREFDRTVGLLANNLVMRIDLSGEPTFEQLVARVRQVALQSYTHQAMPFEKIVESIDQPAHGGGNPLFDVYFNYIDQSRLRLELSGVDCRPMELIERGAKHDLTCFYLRGDTHRVMINYNSELFDESTAKRLLASMVELLRQVVGDPTQPISRYSILDQQQRAALASFNATEQVFKDQDGNRLGELPLHELFRRCAFGYPQRIAVSDERRSLSFEQLEQQSSRLARMLQSQGVTRGDLIGIFLERSVELEIALLAVLKCDAAYVPLEPSYPAARLEMMLRDSAVKRVIAHEPTRAALAKLGVQPETIVDVEATVDAHEPLDIAPHFDPDDLAYVIYTSGSTGVPKGAMNHHRGIVNRLLWMQEAFKLTESDVVLQKTPAGFDVSVWEFFWPIIAGARLHMARSGGHQDPQYLIQTIQNEKITTIHFVPSMLRAFLDARGVEACGSSLRRVICSGEALSPDLRDRFHQLLPGVELHNLYGPTEAAVDVTHHACRRPADAASSSTATVPIGRPIANTQIHILDAHLQPLPIGVPGELHIGGVQVAHGYLNRTQLTGERFIDNPFGGGKLYKSGDLARWLADGQIEFLGRLDSQVKIRGHRIELGEVESAILATGNDFGISETAVIARGHVGQDQHLVAYLVLDAGRSRPGIDQLRAGLSAKLTDAMIPSQFVFLDHLPLSANGKLDRRALPEPPALDRAALAQRHVPPQTPLQRILVDIWQQLLRVGATPIGINDNFFALGGDSILAMQVVARVRDLLRTDVQLRGFFAAPTVAGWSQDLENDRENGQRIRRAAELLEQIEAMSDEQMQQNLIDKPGVPPAELLESRTHE